MFIKVAGGNYINTDRALWISELADSDEYDYKVQFSGGGFRRGVEWKLNDSREKEVEKFLKTWRLEGK